jgi:hypothetical protein
MPGTRSTGRADPGKEFVSPGSPTEFKLFKPFAALLGYPEAQNTQVLGSAPFLSMLWLAREMIDRPRYASCMVVLTTLSDRSRVAARVLPAPLDGAFSRPTPPAW